MTSAFSEYLFLIQFGPAVLNSVPVLAVDLADGDMKIVYASPLLEVMFGYERTELIGKPLDVLLPEKFRAVHREHFKKYQQTPDTRSMNEGVWVEALKKDGTQFKAQVSLCPQPVGKMDCVIACIADVTNAYQRIAPEIERPNGMEPELEPGGSH